MRLFKFAFLATATLALSAAPSFADARTPFAQDRNLVRNIFADENTTISKTRDLEYFPAQKQVGEAPQEAIPPQQQPEETEKAPEKVAEAKDKTPATAEEIVEKFGNPTERRPVLAKADAPEAFQGLQAALEIGNKELAFQFARQYVRYMREIQERGNQISALMKQANLAEKLEDDDQTEEVTVKEVEEYEEYLAMQRAGLPPEARAMLANAEKFEDLKSDNRLERQKARKALKALLQRGEIPVDPKGAVNVFFFIDLNSEKSLQMAETINALYRRSQKDPGLNVAVYTLDDGIAAEDVRNFTAKTRAQYPILAGMRLAVPLGVKEAPTTVFTTLSTAKSLIRSEIFTPVFADELVNVMQSKGM